MQLPITHDVLNSLVTAISGGMFLTLLSRRLNVPAIILLLAGGVAFGPEGIGLVQPASLDGFLPVIVSLAVGVILFEGGLTLDLRGYAKGSTAIARLLTIGVLITWLGSALSIWAIFRTSPAFALLAGSLVIVTGPTVIGPLLRRIKIQATLHSVLHWESVLIDAIGVFIAILCFEWLAERSGEAALAKFALRTLSGLVIGTGGGFAIVWAFRRRLIPETLLNGFALGSAVLIFGLAEAVISEAGLLAVTIAGFVVGWKHHPGELRAIRQFKAEITDLLIGMLFILLASRLRFAQFHDFGGRGLLLLAAILLLVRPLNVLLSTWGSTLNWREKVFLAWIAPRGIVAASMASLFAIALGNTPGGGNARFLETFVYSVIVATVVLQGSSAGPLAKLLRLQRPDPTGWLIVNADAFGRRLAQLIRDEAKLDVLVIDTNARLIGQARAEGLPALCEDALNIDLTEDRPEFQKLGHLLALTDNPELNELLCGRWTAAFGRDNVYRWSAAKGPDAAGLHDHGLVAFAQLPRPSVLAAELANAESRLDCADFTDEPVRGAPLLTFRAGAVLVEVEAPDLAEATAPPVRQAGDRLVLLQRTGGFFARSFSLGGMIESRAGTLPDMYRELVDAVLARYPGVSKDQMLEQIVAGDALVPAWLGHGVGIPHWYSSQITQRVCLLARLRAGLRVPDQDEPLRLVFFLVSPAGDPEGHLATLAEIARFCGSAANRHALLEFTVAADAERYILEHARA